MAAGIYHYDVEEAQLVLQREGNYGREASEAALGQELVANAGAVFVWTAMVERSKWKYRERAYRYIYMDVGHIGQNLYLAATALDLGCCTIGAFYDEEVDRLVGVDGEKEISVYMGAIRTNGIGVLRRFRLWLVEERRALAVGLHFYSAKIHFCYNTIVESKVNRRCFMEIEDSFALLIVTPQRLYWVPVGKRSKSYSLPVGEIAGSQFTGFATHLTSHPPGGRWRPSILISW
jgi:hypothetical protein